MLTYLWRTLPSSWWRRLGDQLGIPPANVHDWLCPTLGCICDPLADHILEAEIDRWLAEHEHAHRAPPAAV